MYWLPLYTMANGLLVIMCFCAQVTPLQHNAASPFSEVVHVKQARETHVTHTHTRGTHGTAAITVVTLQHYTPLQTGES
jgi:hypothetical protein